MSEVNMTFFDVGHGSCTHIQTPNETNILVDIGGGDDFSPAYHLANICKISQLDALVITHPHEDHYHDIVNLERHSIKPKVLSLAKSGFPIDRTKFDIKDRNRVDYINAMNDSYTKEVPSNEDPFSEYVNGGLKWQTFSPDKSDQDREDPNTLSKVYVLNFGGCKVVLTGDNNKEILVKMMKKPEFVSAIKNADFLLAPHHGRTTDFCPEFFAMVNPHATIISDKCCEHDSQLGSSCAYNNGRGIWLHGEARHVLTTRKDGNIVLRFDQFGNYSFNSWHHTV